MNVDDPNNPLRLRRWDAAHVHRRLLTVGIRLFLMFIELVTRIGA